MTSAKEVIGWRPPLTFCSQEQEPHCLHAYDAVGVVCCKCGIHLPSLGQYKVEVPPPTPGHGDYQPLTDRNWYGGKD